MPSGGGLRPKAWTRSIFLAASAGSASKRRGSSVSSSDCCPARSFLPRRRPCSVRRRASSMKRRLHHHVDQVRTLLRHGVGEMLGELFQVVRLAARHPHPLGHLRETTRPPVEL